MSVPETKEIESSPRPSLHGFKIRRWLNSSRAARHNPEYYVSKMRRVFDFRQPATYWAFGKRLVGKSTILEWLAINYVLWGSTVFDIFSARDDESLAWLRSGFEKILLIVGDSINLKFEGKKEWDWIHVSDFTLSKAEQYQVVLTVPSFFASEHEMYSTLSKLIDILKQRKEWSKIDFLVVREASRLIASRIMSGKVQTKMEAEYDFLELVQESYHNGVGVGVDSLRPVSIEISIREIANFSFVKRMGRLGIPREFKLLMHYLKPNYIRKMPLDHFVLYTDSDDLFVGEVDQVPWHIVRGENITKSLGISTYSSKPDAKELTVGNVTRGKIDEGLHRLIIDLRNQQKSFEDIVQELSKQDIKISWQTARFHVLKHRDRTCACYEGV